MLEGGEGDYDNPDGDNGARLVKKPCCKLTNHNWEHCNNSKYVKTGRLFRRSCEECKVKFQYPGWKHTQEKTWNVTSRTYVVYCTYCKVALCCFCNPKFIEKQRIEQGKGSPRKAKKNIVKYGV
jgi:hypothetical protein